MLDKFGRGVERGFQRLFTSNRRHIATPVDAIAVMQATKELCHTDSAIRRSKLITFNDLPAAWLTPPFSDGMDSGQYVSLRSGSPLCPALS